MEIEISSFLDSGNQIKAELISDQGSGNIKEIIAFLQEPAHFVKKNKKDKELKINQLRKFYDSFLRIYQCKENETVKKVQLLMLKANAEYSANRIGITRFRRFLGNRIDIVLKKNGTAFEENLKAFKLHFEALVAYYPKEEKE